MKQLATLVLVALGCSFAQAAEPAKTPQQNRMSLCQKEATASGKKGKERSEVLRTCLSAGKTDGKADGKKDAKPA